MDNTAENVTRPNWMDGFKPDPDAPTVGNPDWRKGMKSPNPAGRPRGVIDKRLRVTKMLQDDADKVVRVVIDAALDGDIAAAGIVLSRIAPPIKAQSEKVEFEFDATAPMTQQVQHVLQGIADGKVPADTAKEIISAIASLAGIKQIDELESRIKRLESTQ